MSKHTWLSLLILVGTTHLSTILCDTVEYYVTPTTPPNLECPQSKPCYTLDEYASNTSSFFNDRNDIALIFLDGAHNLTHSSFLITNVSNLTLFPVHRPIHNSTMPKVTIHICPKCKITLVDILTLKMEYLMIMSINQNYRQDVGLLEVTNVWDLAQNRIEMHYADLRLNNIFQIRLLDSKYRELSAVDISLSYFPWARSTSNSHGDNPESFVYPAQVNITNCTMINTGITVTAAVLPGNYTNQTKLAISLQKTMIVTRGDLGFGDGVRILTPKNIIVNVSVTSCTFLGRLFGIVFFSKQVTIYFKLLYTTFESIRRNAVSLIVGDDSYVYSSILNSDTTNTLDTIEISTGHRGEVHIQMKNCNTSRHIYSGSALHIETGSDTLLEAGVVRNHFNGGGVSISTQEHSIIEAIIQETNIAFSPNEGVLLNLPLSKATIQLLGCDISQSKRGGVSVVKTHPDEGGLYNVSVINCDISRNQGGGIVVFTPRGIILLVQQTTLSRNQPTAINLVLGTSISENFSMGSYIALVDCKLENNRGTTLKVYSDYKDIIQQHTVCLRNVSFSENHDAGLHSSTVKATGPGINLLVENSSFENNLGTPIVLISGTLTFDGNTVFFNNVGFQGGALSLVYSRIYISKDADVHFMNNLARDVGGAVYVQYSPESLQCFYQFFDRGDGGFPLVFSNNTAERGGEQIFGAVIRFCDCFIPYSSPFESLVCEQKFHFDNSSKSSLSVISSDPLRVCLCDSTGKPMCTDIDYIFKEEVRFPGEQFNISAVIVGYEFGTVSSLVYASLFPQKDSNASLGYKQAIQAADYRHCNNLTYSIYSTLHEVIVLAETTTKGEIYGNKTALEHAIYIYNLVNWDIKGDLLSTPVFINVTIQTCPSGFEIAGDPLACDCSEYLRQYGITECSIVNHTGYIQRSGTIWIGKISKDNDTDGVVAHEYCPFDYCNTEEVAVDLNQADVQCLKKHSGVLCGKCKSNLSLALGSSNCLVCTDNSRLALLLVFMVAGVALVLFLKILNLTVAQGTINGLIFYANVVWINESILLPASPAVNTAIVDILRAFIAWLNLDLGIETCFIMGLDAYWKTWLQFVFPIYIWSICGFIILVCHYNTWATKLFGNNSVPVLATLFLLSFMKLLRNIVITLTFTVLYYPEGPRVVWSFDGNVLYFGERHAFLFLGSLVALILFCLPLLITLLLVQPLRKWAHLRLLKWINKLKPVFDAFTGPMKDKYTYWTGLLLLARGILLITFVTMSAIAPMINLVAIVLITTLLLLHPYVYKKWYLSLIENSFLFNLTALACIILYLELKENQKNKMVIACVSIGIANLQLLMIVIIHAWHSLRQLCNKSHVSSQGDGVSSHEESQHQTQSNAARTQHHLQWSSRLRESLLESVNSTSEM